MVEDWDIYYCFDLHSLPLILMSQHSRFIWNMHRNIHIFCVCVCACADTRTCIYTHIHIHIHNCCNSYAAVTYGTNRNGKSMVNRYKMVLPWRRRSRYGGWGVIAVGGEGGGGRRIILPYHLVHSLPNGDSSHCWNLLHSTVKKMGTTHYNTILKANYLSIHVK